MSGFGFPSLEIPVGASLADELIADEVVFEISEDGDNPLFGFPNVGPVSANAVAAAQAVYREIGVDALAFYKSFRFRERKPYPGMWGIFLFDAGIMAVANEFCSQKKPPPRWEAERLAFQTLLQHERYHFWIDAWTLAQEVMPFTPQRKRYEYYLEQLPSVELTEFDDEESLANFYVMQRFRDVHLSDGSPVRRLVRSFFATCPIPYSIFNLDAQHRAIRERRLAGALSNGLNSRTITVASVDAIAANIGKVLANGIRPSWVSYPFAPYPLCPTYVVRDRNYAARVQPFQGPDRTEFKRFVVSYLSGQELGQTDHMFYKIDNGTKIKFPNAHEKDIRGYELKNILLKAGMRYGEFVQARQHTKGWTKGCPRNEPKPPLAD